MVQPTAAPAAPAAPVAAPAPAPAPVAAPEPVGLSASQAESQLADLFARSRGEPKGGREANGRFKGEEPAEPAPAVAPVEADADGAPLPESDEPTAAPAEDDDDAPGIPGAEDDEPAAAGADLPEEVEYEHNGRTYKVPKPLVEGAMRQADYTQGMQRVSEQTQVLAAREQAIAQQQARMQELALPIATIQNTREQIASIRGAMPDPEQDPVRYMKLDKQARDLEAGLQQLEQAVAKRGTELAQQEQSARAELLKASYAAVSRAIPKWTDQAYRTEVAQHALTRGFTQPELDGMTDPRVVGLLNDAMLYRRIQQAKADVRKKLTEAPPVVRPGAATNRAATQQAQTKALKDRAKKSGSTGDAQAAIRALLESARKKR
jgi:Predicted membrane protein